MELIHRATARTLFTAAGLCLLWLAPISAEAQASNAARKQARDAIRQWTLKPKLDIGMRGLYQVNADGTPTDAKQGKVTCMGCAMKGYFETQACMKRGSYYKPKSARQLDFEVDAKRVQLVLFNCAKIRIHYPRRLTDEDLEPQRLARALNGMFEISGPGLQSPTRSLARLDKALRDRGAGAGAAGTGPQRAQNPFLPPPTTPEIASLTASTSAAAVRVGQTVELVLAYGIETGSATEQSVVETFSLSLDGQLLPNYPVERTLQRAKGQHESVLPQPIPSAAAPGTYRFKAEVCLGDQCRSHATTFTVQR